MSYDDHRIDPDLLPIIQEQRVRNASRPAMGTIPPDEMRRRAAAEFVEWNSDPVALAKVQDFHIDVPGSDTGIPVRLYDPVPGKKTGCLVYFHGGGWVIGDLELEDAALRRVAVTSGVKLLSVDYRLAPEHPFPAAIEDGEHVVRWLTAMGTAFDMDSARYGLGGASAGANVALGTALRLRDAGGPMPSVLTLLYGAFGGGQSFPSHEEFADGRFGLPLIAMDAFWRAYLSDNGTHPHAVPLHADLWGLPQTFLAEAELDILADETAALAARLEAAAIPVERRVYHGAVHGFTQYAKVSTLGRRALEDAGRAVAIALG